MDQHIRGQASSPIRPGLLALELAYGRVAKRALPMFSLRGSSWSWLGCWGASKSKSLGRLRMLLRGCWGRRFDVAPASEATFSEEQACCTGRSCNATRVNSEAVPDHARCGGGLPL
mmetsp:Transcript_91208/g.190745  ORF Transcript_91208/g.190745 Transcript_91208/m.190745 type:complete len:116 (-) Transcript_91208:2007-2354(-)